jgi:hypothetical protein
MPTAAVCATSFACLIGLAACGPTASRDPDGGGPLGPDAAVDAGEGEDVDAAGADAAGGSVDAAGGDDGGGEGADAATGTPDAATGTPDAATGTPDAAPPPDAPGGVITGGPCTSGSAGATAYRIRWANGGGTAYPVYEINGLPDTSTDHTGAYGYVIGFTPSYVDTFLAEGGLLLNSSSFVDIELSTVGLSSIDTATLSIYGRSYNTTTSGSFHWQTFAGVGAAPTNLVSNSAPYEWYSADMTTEIDPGDDGVLIRIKAGPSSNSLAVHRIELCIVAD